MLAWPGPGGPSPPASRGEHLCPPVDKQIHCDTQPAFTKSRDSWNQNCGQLRVKGSNKLSAHCLEKQLHLLQCGVSALPRCVTQVKVPDTLDKSTLRAPLTRCVWRAASAELSGAGGGCPQLVCAQGGEHAWSQGWSPQPHLAPRRNGSPLPFRGWLIGAEGEAGVCCAVARDTARAHGSPAADLGGPRGLGSAA